jgi:FkbM family methyltransferase
MRAVKVRLDRMLGAVGYELRHIGRPYSIPHLLRELNVDVVIDVGANAGQFARSVRNGGYRGRILSYEPNPEIFAELQTNCASDKNWRATNIALGGVEGRLALNVTRDSVFSSFRRQNAIVKENFGEASRACARVDVDIGTLDAELESVAGDALFIKCDTQGFDEDVLNGAIRSLHRTVGVMLELSSTPLYENSWNIVAAVDRLEKLGFVVQQVHPVNFAKSSSSRALEFDFVFVRATS